MSYGYSRLASRSNSVIDQQLSPTLASSPSAGPLPSRSRRNVVPAGLALAAGLVLLYCFAPSESVDSLQSRLSSLSQPLSSLVQNKRPGECDPFDEYGQVEAVLDEPEKNLWRPWDRSCPPSTLLSEVRNGTDLPWLRDRTVAVIGDSIDRDHIEYFCELSRGTLERIWEGTEHSPPYTFSKGDSIHYNASDNGQAEGGAQQSRPRACHLERYNFTILFVFNFGLSEGTEAERSMPHFYPPFEFSDRMHNILIPILKSMNRYPPSLVEFSSGSWDLQHWTLEDRVTDADRLHFLTSERTDWYREKFVEALREVEEAFPDEKKTALLLRELQHTKLVDTVPPPRVHALQNLQALLLQWEKEARVRWQLDPLGRILLGQEHNFRDMIHPILLPAGKIWGDIILHKLRAHVLNT